MGSTIIDQGFPYDIVRRGSRDESRHNKRVDEATRKQLKDIISSQDIITSEGNKKIKVRLKYLDQYRFVHNKDAVDSLGRDQFDDLDEGEILSRPNPGGQGKKPQASDDRGEELYEAEYSLEEITEMMIEELELPDLDDTRKNEIVSEVIEYTDRRKENGIYNLLDKRKTILANILRKKQGKTPFRKEDLRFKTWDVAEEKHSNAVIFLMMDRSGSMWEDKIYAVKALYFWIVQFLRRRYDNVEIKFIAHDYDAMEMSEKDFFSISDSGGTRVSEAYKLCRDMIKHNYPAESWNIYCFHSSDGDTWSWGPKPEEETCMKLVKEIMDLGSTMFAYTEINMDSYREGDSNLLAHFYELIDSGQDGVLVSVVREMSDIMDTLRTFLRSNHRRTLEAV